jgi:gluconolactonase
VLAPGVVPELVQGGFTALEGPVGAADGTVYFSDRMPDRTYHLRLDGKITVYQENTGAANGLAFTRDGDIVRAEGGAKRIGKVTRDGKVSVLTDSYNGKPLVSPNDLIVDAKGGIYFTDPGPRPVMPGRPTNVYYLPAGAKEPILVDDQNPRPNGLTLTLDGRTLLVDNTVGPVVFAFDVQSDGTVKNRRPYGGVGGAEPRGSPLSRSLARARSHPGRRWGPVSGVDLRLKGPITGTPADLPRLGFSASSPAATTGEYAR